MMIIELWPNQMKHMCNIFLHFTVPIHLYWRLILYLLKGSTIITSDCSYFLCTLQL